jgi:endonuclease III
MDIADIPAVNRILARAYKQHAAPIVELIQAQTHDPFKILVATILSARTKDETTSEVARRLFKTVHTPDDLRRLTPRRIEKMIFPIGFYRTKARHLRALPDVLDREFGGRIPQTIDALCRLPGVGRKTANLVVTVAFNKPGICVDVHVHRICNRLGLLQTRTPYETEMELRRILPRRYWKTWNRQLVSFGQTRCRPIGPQCAGCPIAGYCASSSIQPASSAVTPTIMQMRGAISSTNGPTASRNVHKNDSRDVATILTSVSDSDSTARERLGTLSDACRSPM